MIAVGFRQMSITIEPFTVASIVASVIWQSNGTSM